MRDSAERVRARRCRKQLLKIISMALIAEALPSFAFYSVCQASIMAGHRRRSVT